jgi:hypothetical protein
MNKANPPRGLSKIGESSLHNPGLVSVLIDAPHLQDEKAAIDLEWDMVHITGKIIIGIFDPATLLAVHCCAILDIDDSLVVLRFDEKVQHGDFTLFFLLDLRDADGGPPTGGLGNGQKRPRRMRARMGLLGWIELDLLSIPSALYRLEGIFFYR